MYNGMILRIRLCAWICVWVSVISAIGLVASCGVTPLPDESVLVDSGTSEHVEAEREAITDPEYADDSVVSEPEQSGDRDLREAAPDITAELDGERGESELADCPKNCGELNVRCVDRFHIQRCIAVGDCIVWTPPEHCGDGKECQAGKCVTRTCDGLNQCGTDHHCAQGTCASNQNCCQVGANECKDHAERRCEQGPDQCGQWTLAQPCAAGADCLQNKCQICRHRPCNVALPNCCSNTSCLYDYCLVQCDENKGDINNPDCEKDEFCLALKPGAQAHCYADGTEAKGSACSIIKPCIYSLACVNAGKGFTCYTECNPKQGGAGNPDCEQQEQCLPVWGIPSGGICLPFSGQAKKLYETCNADNPCISPNLCIGESGSSAHCLEPCDPTLPPEDTCSPDHICTSYDPQNQQKGVCIQRCYNPGTPDVCKYGTCQSKQGESICL